MRLHLDDDIFKIVKNGSKDIEIRLNDDKRKKLNIGDNLIFINRLNNEKIEVKISNLEIFSNIDELCNKYDIRRMYKDNVSKEEFIKLINRFYSDKEIENLGILAITFRRYK